MSFDLTSIKKGACVKAPRMQIIATPGFGKTSFAACYTNKGRDRTSDTDTCLVIPIKGETGADGLDVDKVDPVGSVNKLNEIIEFFITNETDYKRIVIDSTSTLEPLVDSHVCGLYNVDNVKKVKGFQVGEMEVKNTWRGILNRLDCLREKGIEAVFTTHAKVKKFKDPDSDAYDRWVSDLDDSTASIIDKWCDIVGFGMSEIIIRTEDEGFGNDRKRASTINPTRWLHFKPSATRPGKVRPEFSRIDERIELDHIVFREAIAKSVAHLTATK
tara:strand:+ start:14 stop:832 length:819 start_codon:yes stop_codon:yes gene_type:complete